MVSWEGEIESPLYDGLKDAQNSQGEFIDRQLILDIAQV